MEIPLAKWTTPGIKRVRFLSVQQGFAVARAMISATRTAAPSAEELKDLDESGVAMPVEEKTDRMKEVDPKKPPPRKGKPRDE